MSTVESKISEFSRSLSIQGKVLEAIVLREMKGRYGQSSLGYLWALVEPLLLVGVFTLGYFAIGKRSAPNGMDFLPFLATGIITYLSMRNIASRMSSAVENNRGLLIYPHVTPFDLIVARLFLEGATFIVVFCVILGGGIFLGYADFPDNPLLLLLTLFTVILLGAGIGMLIASLSLNFPWIERVVKPCWRLLMWTSGLFFTLKQLPVSVQDILVWNPILHVIELMRAAYFPGVEPYRVSYTYVGWWILVTAFFGLLCERVFRDRKKEK